MPRSERNSPLRVTWGFLPCSTSYKEAGCGLLTIQPNPEPLGSTPLRNVHADSHGPGFDYFWRNWQHQQPSLPPQTHNSFGDDQTQTVAMRPSLSSLLTASFGHCGLDTLERRPRRPAEEMADGLEGTGRGCDSRAWAWPRLPGIPTPSLL